MACVSVQEQDIFYYFVYNVYIMCSAVEYIYRINMHASNMIWTSSELNLEFNPYDFFVGTFLNEHYN